MFSIGDYVKRTDLQNKIDLKILSEQELKFSSREYIGHL